MIVIRQQQVDAFKGASQLDFERRLLRGLAEAFPNCEARFGAAAIAHMIRLGIERAKAHELQAEAEVQCYLRLMLLFGAAWERDPQLPWVPALLAAEGVTPPQRIARIWDQAQVWRQRVMGPNDSLYLAALRSLEGKSVDDLCKNSSRSQRDLMIQLAAMYPRKFTEVGEQPLYDLTRLAVEACRPFELMDRWAVVLLAELMFLFGAGVMSDPLYAWAGEALGESGPESIDRRLERLLQAAQQRTPAAIAAGGR